MSTSAPRDRAFRRAMRARLQCRRAGYWGGRGLDARRLGMVVDTPTPCSCGMCSSPRRSKLYKTGASLTLQERRALLDHREALAGEVPKQRGRG